MLLLLTSLLQETGPVVGWDLRTVCYGGPSMPVRLYVLFLLGAVVSSVIVVAKIWKAIGFRSAGTRQILGAVFNAVGKGDHPDVLALVAKLSSHAPEVGLRALASAAPSDSQGFLSMVSRADVDFRYCLQTVASRVEFLGSLCWATLIATLLVLVIETANVLRQISMQKTIGWTAIAGGIAEGLVPAVMGLIALLFVFVLHRHLLARMKRRRASWEYFVARIRGAVPAK